MRLLYLQQLFVLPGSPGITHGYDMAQHWAEAGHSITVLCSQAGFPSHRRSSQALIWQEGRFTVHALPIDYDHHFSFPRRAWAFFRFFQSAFRYALAQLTPPDVMLAYSPPLSVSWLGQRLARHWRAPLVLELADAWPEVPIEMGIVPPGPWRTWLRKRTQDGYHKAAGIIALSPGIRELVIGQGIAPEKVKVSYNGTRPASWPLEDRQRPEGHAVELLYAGTVGVANDLSQLLQAVAILEKEEELPPFRLTVLGQGNDLSMVKDESKRLGLRKVRFLGQVPREALPEYFQAADVGLICFAPYPVLETNGANKFFDYLAAGLPVVLNYEGWQGAVLAEAQAGRGSIQGDPASFARQLRLLICDQPLRLAMGQRGRRYAQQHYDRAKLAPAMWNDIVGFIDRAKP